VIEPDAETLAVELSVPVVLEEAVALTVAVPVVDGVCTRTRTRERQRWDAWGPEINGCGGGAPRCRILPRNWPPSLPSARRNRRSRLPPRVPVRPPLTWAGQDESLTSLLLALVDSLGVADSELEALTVALGVSDAVRELVAVAEVELVPLSVCRRDNGQSGSGGLTGDGDGSGRLRHVIGSAGSRLTRGTGTGNSAPSVQQRLRARVPQRLHARHPMPVSSRGRRRRPQGARATHRASRDGRRGSGGGRAGVGRRLTACAGLARRAAAGGG